MVEILKECLEEGRQSSQPDKETQKRLREMLEFFEDAGMWFEKARRLPPGSPLRSPGR